MVASRVITQRECETVYADKHRPLSCIACGLNHTQYMRTYIKTIKFTDVCGMATCVSV